MNTSYAIVNSCRGSTREGQRWSCPGAKKMIKDAIIKTGAKNYESFVMPVAGSAAVIVARLRGAVRWAAVL